MNGYQSNDWKQVGETSISGKTFSLDLSSEHRVAHTFFTHCVYLLWAEPLEAVEERAVRQVAPVCREAAAATGNEFQPRATKRGRDLN